VSGNKPVTMRGVGFIKTGICKGRIHPFERCQARRDAFSWGGRGRGVGEYL